MADFLSGLDGALAGYAELVPTGELVPSVEALTGRLREVARRAPGLCRMRRIGSSRRGRALDVLSVGTGRRPVLVVGGPHPNEPVGYATIAFLAELTAARPELRDGMSWHFLPCVDPDGAALNEEWTSAPLDLHTEHRHFFRPALAEQPEWTFPIPWRGGVHRFGLPEQQALADLVDELEPAAVVSLHNAEFGEPFFILSRDVPGLAARLAAVAARSGLPVGEAPPSDVVGWPVLGDGVYGMPPIEELLIRDHDRQAPAYGAHLTHYAARHGSLTLLPEVPRWHAATRFHDGPPTALTALARALTGESEEVQRLLEQAGPHDDAFARAAADTLAVADSVTRAWLRRAEDTAPVTGVELAEAHYARVVLTLRSTAMALRSATEAQPGRAAPHVRARLEAVLAERAERCRRRLRIRPVELRRLVAVQACAALAAAALTW
ncbi:M14 family zinc carboxypeptidase [Kitasatospora sp. NPDC056273]|uniref:M14 family zinc carboxypeptidase n=1 Tax=Kitasatospora sp. NPDC056273 TaxID=3345769 RepID=UPI0035DF2293